MNKWVECLCRVCGFKPDAPEDEDGGSSSHGSSQLSVSLAEIPISPKPIAMPTRPRPQAGSPHQVKYPANDVRKSSTPYIPLTDCVTGSPGGRSACSQLDSVPPAPSGSHASRVSLDSIPDEDPPPPPTKLGEKSREEVQPPAWDPNQTYDLPKHNYTNLPDEGTYNVPPPRNHPQDEQLHKVPPTRNLQFVNDDFYNNYSPSKRQFIQTDSVYNVPRPQPQTKTTSQRDSGSSNGSHTSTKQDSAYESGDTYDYPKKHSIDAQSMDALTERLRSSSLVQTNDFYDTPRPRKAQSVSNILDRVPPPPRPPRTNDPCLQVSEERLPYENLPPNSKSHPGYVSTDPHHASQLEDMYDVPPSSKMSDVAKLNMSPPPPKPCMGLMTDHSYVNEPGSKTESMYLPMQGGGDEIYLPMNSGEGWNNHRESEIYTPMSGTDSIYVEPPSNRPVSNSNRLYTQRPTPATRPAPAPRLQRLAAQNQPDGATDTYDIFTTHRTRSFKRQISSKPEIPLPTKRRDADSSSSDDDDDDDDSISSHDKSQDSMRGTTPVKNEQTVPKKSLKSTPPPPKRPGGEVQYLDLDLDDGSDVERSPVLTMSQPASNTSPTDYKEIDFVKTKGLSETRKDLENKRKSSEKSVDE